MLSNVRGCDIVLSAAARHGRRLLFTSTSEIYGKLSGESLPESSDRVLGSPFQSRWSYSTAKAFGEILAVGYHREAGAETTVARLFNTVGPRQTGAYGMVLPRFVRQALNGEDLTVYGTGTQSRCFTHVLDTVHALVLLCDADGAIGNVYNVGRPSPVSVIELAGKVIERDGLELARQARPLRRGLRPRLRGARAPGPGHLGARGAHRLDAVANDRRDGRRRDRLRAERGAQDPGGASARLRRAQADRHAAGCPVIATGR